MFSSGMPQVNFDDLISFDDNNGGDFDFNGFNYLNPSNVAGPSQTYLGADVLGNFNSYPESPIPSIAPISLGPINESYSNEGYASQFYQGVSMPSSMHPTTLPSQLPPHSTLIPSSHVHVPTLSRGPPSLSPEQYTWPATRTFHPHPQPQVIANTGGLGFPALVDNYSLPAADFPSTYGQDCGGFYSQFPPLNPLSLNFPLSNSIEGAGKPEIHPAQPVASSSGPKRTKRSARESQRHNPLFAAQKKADCYGWDQILARFRAHADNLYGVHNGQPSGGLTPEKALANLTKFVKEDLKRSPLNSKKAGEGKRCRDVETYLDGLLQAIRQVDQAPVPAGDGSIERGTIANMLSRLADELEAKLAVINHQPALRQPPGGPQRGKRVNGEQTESQKKKSQTERERRENERHHLGRISRLFRAPTKLWSKKDVLGLVLLYLLYGPAAFPPNFVLAHQTVTGI